MDKKNKTTCFVKTTDAHVADLLRKSGFTEITETGSTHFCFLNDGHATFDADTQKRCVYTDVLAL